MQSLTAESAILSNVHREVVNVQQDIWHFQWFCVMFCSLWTKRKGSCLLYAPPFFPPWRPRAFSVRLSAEYNIFCACFIYYMIYCCQNGPTVLFAPHRRSDLGLTCVSCQSKLVKMALLTWPLKPAPGLGGTTGLTLLRFVIMGEHWFTVITGLLWFLQNLYSVTITWLQ